MNSFLPLYIKKKYGNDLTISNAKDIYFDLHCQLYGFVGESELKFYEDNFSFEIYEEWHNEYINKQIDYLQELFNEKPSLNTIRKHCTIFYKISNIFVKNKDIYFWMIHYLEKLFETYGYFMNYPFVDEIPNDNSFALYRSFLIMGMDYREECIAKRNVSSVIFHYPKENYKGIIPTLYYLEYFDILKMFFDKIVIPYFEHYYESSDLLTSHHLTYYNERKLIEESEWYNSLNDFIIEKEFNENKNEGFPILQRYFKKIKDKYVKE